MNKNTCRDCNSLEMRLRMSMRKKPMTSLMHMRTLIKVYKEQKKTSFRVHVPQAGIHISQIRMHWSTHAATRTTSIHYISLQWTQHTIFEKKKTTKKYIGIWINKWRDDWESRKRESKKKSKRSMCFSGVIYKCNLFRVVDSFFFFYFIFFLFYYFVSISFFPRAFHIVHVLRRLLFYYSNFTMKNSHFVNRFFIVVRCNALSYRKAMIMMAPPNCENWI